jgi:S-adenosylmethionine hydrolase
MIFLATDFGLTGPYTGQVKACLARLAPSIDVIDLFSDLPSFRPDLAAYLLAAYADALKPDDVLLAVVDPGVGSAREPLVLHADDRWFVGPDNGLFELIRRRARSVTCERIAWRPEHLSASFHGRDLFAPVAANLAMGKQVATSSWTSAHTGYPDDLAAIVYIDHYGNGMTGLRASGVPAAAAIRMGDDCLTKARTFSDRPEGQAFWYENANGLVEIAVNGASAAERFGLKPGLQLNVLSAT